MLSFSWTIPIFSKGLKKQLDEDDLYSPLPEHESSMLGDRLEKAWNKELTKKNPSFWRALSRAFFLNFFALSILWFFCEIIKYVERVRTLIFIRIFYIMCYVNFYGLL